LNINKNNIFKRKLQKQNSLL